MTTYTLDFYVGDLQGLSAGDAMVPTPFVLDDADSDLLFEVGETVNGQPAVATAVGDIVVIQPDGTTSVADQITYEGTSFFFSLPPGNDNVFIPTDGQTLVSGTLVSVSLVPPDTSGTVDLTPIICFCEGTLIRTHNGETPVQNLRVGDLVDTEDHGAQAVRWVGRRDLTPADMALRPHLKPVRIAAGALGDGLPLHDLLVSPQHRVMLRSKIAQRMFCADEILVPAAKLVGLEGIETAHGCHHVSYFHFLLDQHEIVHANGLPSESLFTGPEALQAVGTDGRREILDIFPQLDEDTFAPAPARCIVSEGRRIDRFVYRLTKNQKAPIETRI